MNFPHLSEPALSATVDVLVLPVLGDPSRDATFKLASRATKGALEEAARHESFEGKPQQTFVFWTGGAVGAKRILAIGAGPRADLKMGALRDVAATAASHANRVGAESLAFLIPSLGKSHESLAIQMVVEGALLGTYRFNRYLTAADAKKPGSLQSFGLLLDAKGTRLKAQQARAFQTAVDRAQIVAGAVSRARDLVNEPAAAMTPSQLAGVAQEIAKKHSTVTVTVLDRKKCADLGMGMFLAVGQGSDQEPRFIHMTYKPRKKKARKKVALIGKGITFDSGGYSLKPSAAMEDMKVDMAGSAAVISAMDALAALDCEHEVHVVAACCENLVSGRAYKLGDVLTSMDGTTVEINNTDAEGRLTLGDAITYARTKIEPDEMFDFATLTGACMVALGPHTAGVMSDHESLCKGWLAAADRASEDMWRLPLNPRLRDQLKSNVADMRNTGERFGGAITAGLFLKTFARDTSWVHVDIAGPASTTSPRPFQPRGGTGFAVSTIIEYLVRR